MDYENKLVLAPMVRVGTLPFRLLAAQYGADITYGEEIIDHKLVKCERRVNVSFCWVDLHRGELMLNSRNRFWSIIELILIRDLIITVWVILLLRLLAQYGAIITFEVGVINFVLVKCKRRRNEYIGSIDFVEKGTNNVVFRTCDQERNRVVFQMGTSDAVRALTAARMVCKDVAAVDINMGCPKSFSVSGGMGAALLSKPELIHDILTTLKRNLNLPVTCKIRLLKSSQDTVELARRIEKTGVAALAVHGRKVADRPRDPAKWSEIADVVASLSIPVIANGDVFEYDDIQRIKTTTGASSVMIARGALWNASVFSPKGKLHWEHVKREYVRKTILWDNDVKSTKHTLKEIIMHYSSLELPEGKAVIKSENLEDIAQFYGEEKYYHFVNENSVMVNGGSI